MRNQPPRTDPPTLDFKRLDGCGGEVNFKDDGSVGVYAHHCGCDAVFTAEQFEQIVATRAAFLAGVVGNQPKEQQ